MAYYPRVFYENGADGGGGASGAADAALAQGRTPEEVQALIKAYEDQKKAEEEIRAAREAGNQELVRILEERNRLARENSEISQQQLDLMNEHVAERERERQALEEANRETEALAELELQRLSLAQELVDEIINQTIALQDTRKELGLATGLFGQFNQQLTDSVATAARFGKDQGAVQKTIGSLANNMMNFTQMSKDNQKTLIDSSMALGQFGVDAETAAKNNDFLMNSLGRSAEEAVGFQKDLIELGAEIGMNGKKLVEGFGKNAETLAKFGDHAEKVFMDLAKTAKETGVEMDELFKVTEKFNTFDGAASAVGKMNAQLGTNLDAMALLQAETPTDQINMLRDAFLETGQSIENMTKFQRMAAADAMGMDVSVLQNLLGPKEELPVAEKKFDDLMSMTMTFMDKIGAIGKQMLTAFTPVISIFADILDFVSPVLDIFGMVLLKISEMKPVIYALAAAFGAYSLVVNAAAIGSAALAAGQALLLAPMIATTVAQYALNLAMTLNPLGLVVAGIAAVVVGFMAFGESLGGLGEMWDMVVGGMMFLWDNFSEIVFFLPLNMYRIFKFAFDNIGGAWDMLVEGMMFLWENFSDIVFFLPKTMYEVFKFAFNGLASIFNSTLGQLSFTIPDWVPLVGGKEFGIPQIPLLAKGTDNFEGGSAIVGEQGPELVNLPRGAQVVPNDKLKKAESNVADANTAANNKPPVIKLMLDERELGQAVMDIIDKKLSVTTGIN